MFYFTCNHGFRAVDFRGYVNVKCSKMFYFTCIK